MKELFARWSDQVHFLDVIIRQAHPGPGAPVYRTIEDKQEDARRYRSEDEIPWTLLVDELEGTAHQVYGALADPTYLIDSEGRVAFYNLWTYVPTLHQAIQALLQQGGRGTVMGGVNPLPHMLPAATMGWRGLQRGLPQSYTDLELAAPGTGTATLIGYGLRPILAPFTQRSKPLPLSVKVGLGVGAAALLGLGAWGLKRREA